MTEDKPELPPPPQTLTREQVRAKLEKKDVIVDVPGFGEMRYRSLNVGQISELRSLARQNGNGPDAHDFTLWGIIRSFPDSFTDEDIEWLREADAIAIQGVSEAITRLSGAGGERTNGPLTFRKTPGSRKPVPPRKRAPR